MSAHIVYSVWFVRVLTVYLIRVTGPSHPLPPFFRPLELPIYFTNL